MSFPVHENITAAIKNRLYDYDRTVAVLRTEMLSDFSPTTRQIIIVQQDPTANEDFSCAGNPPALAYTAPYEIVCIIRQRENSSRPIDEILTDFAGGAIQTITTPASSWHQWGGLAIDTRIIGRTKSVLDGYATINIQLEVIYRVNENNPYTQR